MYAIRSYYEDVGDRDESIEVVRNRHRRRHAGSREPLERPQALAIPIQDDDVRAASRRPNGGGPSHDPRTQNHDRGGRHAGNAVQQHPAAALAGLEIVRRHGRRELARTFAHRGQDGPLPWPFLDRLDADGRDPSRDQEFDQAA